MSNKEESSSSKYCPYITLPLQQNPNPYSYVRHTRTVHLPPNLPPVNTPLAPTHPQAQQLFQRDLQTITPEAIQCVKAALARSEVEHKAETKRKAVPRKAAGQTWMDPTLADWPENDYRLFVGNLGNDVSDKTIRGIF